MHILNFLWRHKVGFMLAEYIMYLPLPNLQPVRYILISDQLQYNAYNLYMILNYSHPMLHFYKS
jgi:hypothetical protein